MNSLYAKIIGIAIGVIALLGMVLYIQYLSGENARLQLELSDAQTIAANEKRSRESMQQAALEKVADDTRIDAAEKGLRDELQKIESKIAKGEPVTGDDYARVISCQRMRRTGQVSSPAYKRVCQ